MRTRYTPRAVLFDLDDTLFDQQAASRAALAAVRAEHACFECWSFDEFERAHSRFLEELHHYVIAGTMGTDDARLERFRRLYAAAGVEVVHTRLVSTATSYRGAYLDARRPVAGAVALLRALKPRVKIGVVSNNMLEEQQDKLRLCGFEPFVDALVVSEETGVSKPDPAIFTIALERLECDARAAVMIGDSMANDVEGARAAGIRAIWFNRSGQPGPDAGLTTLTAFEPIEPVLEAIFPCA